MSRVPTLSTKHKICIICEGFEDHAYILRLLEFNVWNDIYEFIPINAKSASNIFPVYQDKYSNDKYELVLIFCDTDKRPYREYLPLKNQLNEFHGNTDAADKIVIFANPCTMQIILSHFGDVSLKNQGKKTNANIIYELTGVNNYDAHEDQITELCSKIFKRTYEPMKERIRNINNGDDVSTSTNFIEFIEKFESDDARWIQDINNLL